MMMSGTSPFAFQSPSYHSSSYLPKLEANFMKDFSCCGLILPTLHDLLQHYEEAHAQKDPLSHESAQPQMPDTRAALAATTANQVQQEAQQRNQHGLVQNGSSRTMPGAQMNQPLSQRAGFSNTLQTIPDMDTVEDMEMDDINGENETTPPPNFYTNSTATTSPQTSFASVRQPQIPQLNTSMMQGHQAYRQSAPTTPVATSRNSAFQGNNASSTLSANPMQQFQDLQNPYRTTPESSAPGTPGELDESLMTGMDDMSMQNNPLFSGLPDGFGNFGYGTNNDMIDLCIDEPAKRLFQQSRTNSNQNVSHQRLGSGQYGANSDIARTIRERQLAAGLPDTTNNILPHEEPKPFRCPVIGCEKAYKNQNGLKYHKSVSFCISFSPLLY
jgi:transcription factor SFP1